MTLQAKVLQVVMIQSYHRIVYIIDANLLDVIDDITGIVIAMLTQSIWHHHDICSSTLLPGFAVVELLGSCCMLSHHALPFYSNEKKPHTCAASLTIYVLVIFQGNE
ncbi:hypothetical protein [Lysinibacillus sp. 3P01SB]|uniref:hypothetical protein n=1 Tax=Lysinibacillus sp. 3P01SB TaxID=3132284 RepID=UPI0039A5442D